MKKTSTMQIATIQFPIEIARNVICKIHNMGIVEIIKLSEEDGKVRKLFGEYRKELEFINQELNELKKLLRLDEFKGELKGEVLINDYNLNDTIKFIKETVGKIHSMIDEVRKRRLMSEERRIEGGLSFEEIIEESSFLFEVRGLLPDKYFRRLEWSLEKVLDENFLLVKRGMRGELAEVEIITLKEYKDKLLYITSKFGLMEMKSGEGEEKGPIKFLRKEEVEEILKAYGKDLMASLELIRIEFERLDALNYMKVYEGIGVIWGWVAQEDSKRLIRELKRIDGRVEVFLELPEGFDLESIPSHVKHNRWIRPFSKLVESFGHPSYEEIDPTPIMAITFPAIFGMMFGDVGHGLLLVIVAAYLLRSRGEFSGKNILSYFYEGAEVLLFCGIWSILFGLLFDSFFGEHGIIEPIWFNPKTNLEMMLLFCVIVGAFHMSLGFLIKFLNDYRSGDKLKAFFNSIVFVWVYWGFIFFFNSKGIDFDKMLSHEPIEVTLMNLKLLTVSSTATFTSIAIFLPISLILVGTFMKKTHHVAEKALSLLSNTISYTRIFALNIIHEILSELFLGLFPIYIEFGLGHLHILGALLGSLIIIPLEGLICFMHTLRLHWVEWFSKFYEGNGRPFKPFKAERFYTAVLP
ncbi:MAG: V-type ATP synthase subunit I [Candidatus Asgardarchaeia archaeon]